MTEGDAHALDLPVSLWLGPVSVHYNVTISDYPSRLLMYRLIVFIIIFTHSPDLETTGEALDIDLLPALKAHAVLSALHG